MVEKWLHVRQRFPRDFELRIIQLHGKWQSLDRVLGAKRIIYVGAVALRLESFFLNVTTNLRDWVRIYLRYLLDEAEHRYNHIERAILVNIVVPTR